MAVDFKNYGGSLALKLIDGYVYEKTAGSNAGDVEYPVISNTTCFVTGTLIDTINGRKPVESLEVGDVLVTLGGQSAAVRWLGSQVVICKGKLSPVHFPEGVIGNTEALEVSRPHRMVVENPFVELMFGVPRVAVRAGHFVGRSGIHLRQTKRVEYHHVLLDRHYMIYGARVASESFDPADRNIESLNFAARAAISQVVPGVLYGNLHQYSTPRVPNLRSNEAKLLLDRIYGPVVDKADIVEMPEDMPLLESA
jgi:hypothetical protein